MDLVLIANPAAGGGRGADLAERAARLLTDGGWRVDLRFSSGPNSATVMAQEVASSQPDAVAVLGGDGTVRDVVEGLLGSPTPLAILPAGTGNDLCRTLKIPTRLEDAVRVLELGQPARVDVWLWNDRPFINVAGVGVDAEAARVANERFKWARGASSYVLALAVVLPGFEAPMLKLRLDDTTFESRVMLAAFANGRYYGGGMAIAPDADPRDELLEVIVIQEMSKAELLWQFPRLFAGKHLSHPKVHRFQAVEVDIEADRPLRATVDGELIGETPATLRLSPAGVRVFLP